jgi:hypothetical protein
VNLSQSREGNSGFSETETPIEIETPRGNALGHALIGRRETRNAKRLEV